MTKILVVGVAVLDFIFQMKEFPRSAEKYRANGAIISGGGNAANAAVALARLGATSHLASRLGDDEIADLIVAGLEKECVETKLVRWFTNNRSSFSSIYIDDDGERQIMNYRDIDLSMEAEWLFESADRDYSAVLCDTRWPQGALAAMNFAKHLDVPGIIDAEAPAYEAEAALNEASHVAFSAQGVLDFASGTDIEAAALAADTRLPGKIIVTDGANGVVVVVDGQPVWYPAFNVESVDTLGAGDIWHGAFALMLGKGSSEAISIGFANAAAALKCMRSGGRDGAPSRLEVERFLEENT